MTEQDCEHRSVRTFFADPYTGGDGTPLGMWACEDCKLRFYPACRTCVDVGHRNIDHPALLADTPSPEPDSDVESCVRWAMTHYDQPLDGDLSAKDVVGLSAFIARHLSERIQASDSPEKTT